MSSLDRHREQHLDDIYRYIARHSSAYAIHTIDRLTKRSIQISTFPLSRRVVPEYELNQIREVIEDPYRIIYYIKPDQIDILAIIHGSQKF